ncbi:hypothetical protein Corgl_0042 [Coriobacterium glomerans PW2]|uniref:Uncharacterized protein n=1 Tax=Coriobacterium glomerans (strain ATCC 49209 / DSM 20642 / JCM 10262 / PW2) TaxID=700015 RepID=F2N6X2_CORGP|nr:hypothetical protein [Coriobacterium glomerans]AEB06171.1 hypothetical protein Corgl_0042 [Coriobacterium glomerans PW2]
MSTRSPMNKRSQTRERRGVARRSAASAKPAREAAGSVRVAPASSRDRRRQLEQGESLQGLTREEKRARRQQRRIQEDRIFDVSNILMKQDDDYRKRRGHLWIVVGVAAVLAAATIIIMFAMRRRALIPPASLQFVSFIIFYGVMIVALIYDAVRLRPIRNFYRAQAQGLSERKLVSLLERAAARDQAARASRRGLLARLVPGRKKSRDADASPTDGSETGSSSGPATRRSARRRSEAHGGRSKSKS